MRKTLTEKQVLKKMGIKNFSEATLDKASAFSDMISHMPVDIAKKALEQFPEFIKFSSNIVSNYKEIIFRGYQESSKTTEAYLYTCNQILESLQKELKKPFLTRKRRDKIINQMIEVALMIDKKDTDVKKFITKKEFTIGGIFLGIIGLVVALITFGKVKIN